MSTIIEDHWRRGLPQISHIDAPGTLIYVQIEQEIYKTYYGGLFGI